MGALSDSGETASGRPEVHGQGQNKPETLPQGEVLSLLEKGLGCDGTVVQFVASGEVSRGTLISAVRNTAGALIATGQHFAQDLTDALARVDVSKRGDEFKQLAAIKDLTEAFNATESTSLTPEARIARDLVEITWMRLFMLYHWLADRNHPET
jgi:hypothetical protein